MRTALVTDREINALVYELPAGADGWWDCRGGGSRMSSMAPRLRRHPTGAARQRLKRSRRQIVRSMARRLKAQILSSWHRQEAAYDPDAARQGRPASRPSASETPDGNLAVQIIISGVLHGHMS